MQISDFERKGFYHSDKIKSKLSSFSLQYPRSPTIPRWRQSVTNWSKWFFNTGQAEAEIHGRSAFESSLNETKLPKLPVPDIEHTLIRYLEALQPILSESHYQRVTTITKNFGADDGIGPKLQEILLKRRELYDNWAYDWWLDDMYLNNPIALPINSNPGMVWPPRNFSTTIDMIRFATRMISAALQYKKKLDRRELPTETVTSKGVTQPMCMAQYYRIFATYRAPGIPKDSQFRSETEYTKARPHVIVACRGQFYVLHLTKGMNSEVLTEKEIASQLLSILNENKEATVNRFPVGVLTGLSRDTWAVIREKLMKDENNQRNLSSIEKCMLVVCLDLEEMPSTFNSKINKVEINEHRTANRDETSMAHQMIHGGGSRVNSGNRWFEKTIQFVIGSDGVNGLCYEHSPAEGVAVINATETILGACTNLEEIIVEPDSSIVPERLNWNLNPTLEKDILSGKEQFDRNVNDLDFNVFRFNGYGKNFIKTCQCSPDGYIQLALQLAYYKIYRHLCATYESASTRRFLLGRVDCIRAETPEALKWVAAMQADLPQAHFDNQRTKPQISREKKLELFQAALKKQVEITTENITGLGIDIHLLGWRQAARDHLISTELFEDESYSIANHFSLSTSQVSTKINSFMGYGPVVPDGYGASYNPKEDSIIFCISSFHSNEVTNTKAFSESLREGLNSMRDLLAYKQQM